MKCISIDLDGTLLNSQHEISDENINTLNQLKAQDYKVILNTGRAYGDVVKIAAVRNLDIPIFCVNGSVLYSETGKLLYEATISIPTYKKVFAALQALGVGILVYTNLGGFPSTLPPLHHKSKEELTKLFQEYNYDDILKQDNLKIYKLIALVHYEDIERIAEVQQALADHGDIAMASSFPNNVEITSFEAQKGKALLRYQEIENLSFKDIYSIGDGGNDLQMFSVSTVSVAMGNAPLNIQEKATLTTKTNDEDGFTYAFRHLLKLI